MWKKMKIVLIEQRKMAFSSENQECRCGIWKVSEEWPDTGRQSADQSWICLVKECKFIRGTRIGTKVLKSATEESIWSLLLFFKQRLFWKPQGCRTTEESPIFHIFWSFRQSSVAEGHFFRRFRMHLLEIYNILCSHTEFYYHFSPRKSKFSLVARKFWCWQKERGRRQNTTYS